MKRTARLAFVSVLLAAASPATAQRSLHWEELKVAARLDADGRLHVSETQTMVLSGDWNGGERRFRLRPEQELDLHRVRRLDPATGAWLSLRQGSLDSVDAYDWHDATTLRWRSRRPGDPPFRDARLVYLLEYSYSNILQPAGGVRAANAHEYRLDHDFAFAERPGVIGRLTLDLELDPAWQALDPLPSGLLATNLPPGRGYVVRLGLRHHGAVPPAGVDAWGPQVRFAVWAGLLLLPPLVLANAWWREQRLGRFAPLPAATRGFLDETVLKAPPEVIGAAWDEQVGAAEVGAVIARLQAEHKLASRVEARPRAGKPEMTLTLLQPLAEFEGYERALLGGLFFGGMETSTEALRRRYQSKGFDPAGLIKPELEKAAEALVGRDRAPKPSWLPATLLFFGGVALLGLGGRPRNDASPVWVAAVIAMVLTWALGAAAAVAWRRRVERGHLAALPLVALGSIPPLVAALFVERAGIPGWRSFTQAGVAAIGLAMFVGVVNAARSRRGPTSLFLRKRLCAVRELFRRELRKARPALEDSWFPYAVAFGLEKDVERWFGRFGGVSAPSSDVSTHHTSSRSGSGPASSNGPAGWTGGGGSFGGGGATSSWTAAVGGLAAGVAAPSSSGSGGGGGGGGSSSSGGGGGGGW